MKTKDRIRHIVKIILITGLIEIICLCTVICVGLAQKKTFGTVIDTEYSYSDALNKIKLNVYYAQDTILNRTFINNTYENYDYELKEALSETKKQFEVLESNPDKAFQKYTNVLSGDIEDFAELCNEDNPVDQTELLRKGRNIQADCATLQMYISSLIQSGKDSISMINLVSTCLSVITMIIIIGAVLTCILTAKSDGNVVAAEQQQTEKNAAKDLKASYTDPLTGLWNRKYIELCLNKKIEEHAKGCLFMIDMDNFKSVNDTYGHIAGDNILKAFATAMKESTRSYDICCRAGGDEFMLYADNLSEVQAVSFYKRLVKNSRTEFDKVSGGTSVTLSVGAEMIMKHYSYEELYDTVDKNLYYVKKTTKNNMYGISCISTV